MKEKNPKAVTAVRKYEGSQQQRQKKKKARPIEGRNVQSAYFKKTLDEGEKPPWEKAWDNILKKLPEQMQVNIRNTCRSVRQAIASAVAPQEEKP